MKKNEIFLFCLNTDETIEMNVRNSLFNKNYMYDSDLSEEMLFQQSAQRLLN